VKNWLFLEERFPFVADSLKNAKRSGRLAHSYLISSSNPDYRLAFPVALACLAACTKPLEDGAPCGKCATCRQLEDGIYPDFFLLSPTSKSREIVIGKDSDEPDTLRWFESLFHLSSITESGWKIGVVADADTMNENAQNAFLKTLEEPPKKCLFILASGSASSLLPTIRSRCQILPLTDNRCEYDFTYFKDMPEALFKLQFQSRGDIVSAEECVQTLSDILDSLRSVATTTITKKWEARLEMAKNLESAGIKLLEKRIAGEEGCEYRRLREQFISILHTWFAQTVLLSAGGSPENLPNPEVSEILWKSGKMPAIDEYEAFRALGEAENLLRALRTNVNDELAMRTFCFNVAVMSK